MNASDLIQWRKREGLTQKKLGELLGVASITVYRWEKEMREIPPFLHLALKFIERERAEAKAENHKEEGGE